MFKEYAIVLEKAAFAGKCVQVKTKGRGVISGRYGGVDEFEYDPERLGFIIHDTAPHEYDIVYPEEIVSITAVEQQIESAS